MGDQLDACGATVEIGAMPALKTIHGLLDSIFQNLFTNAIKYRSDQPLEISVYAEKTGSEWVFSFTDNGIGIAPEYHERIFGVFKRLHNDPDVPGTGIGLAICKVAVEKMGGRIWVESDGVEGQGSKFTFLLPLMAPENPALHPAGESRTRRRSQISH